MMISKAKEWDYFSWDGREGIIIPVKRDEEAINRLREAELAFIARIEENRPPEPTDRDWVVVDDPYYSAKSSLLQHIDAEISALEEKREEIRKILIEKAETIHDRVKMGAAHIQRVKRKGNIDYARIPELAGIDLEPYRRPDLSSWRVYL